MKLAYFQDHRDNPNSIIIAVDKIVAVTPKMEGDDYEIGIGYLSEKCIGTAIFVVGSDSPFIVKDDINSVLKALEIQS